MDYSTIQLQKINMKKEKLSVLLEQDYVEEIAWRALMLDPKIAVSYTHLTLPTKRIV